MHSNKKKYCFHIAYLNALVQTVSKRYVIANLFSSTYEVERQ